MAAQYSVAVRNAMLDAIETSVGASAKLRMFPGAPPANCGAADSGTIIAEMSLPSDWLNNASAGSKSKNGTWEDPTANNPGILGHYRIYDTTFAVCHHQGTITETSGGGDMEVDNNDVNAGQQIVVTAFQFNIGGA